MQKTLKSLISALASLALLFSLTACANQKIEMSNVTGVIDVRTADEFAGGHLAGAMNIDVESPDFKNQINTLDRAGDYVVYCHSGRRAAVAIDIMKADAFFGNLTNAGGIAEATVATGLEIVTN